MYHSNMAYNSQTISIDADAEMTVPYHFHFVSDEYLAVTHGVVEMTVNGKTQKRTPEMGELYIPKRVRHAIRKPKGVAGGWTARTLPNLPEKARFFRSFAASGPVSTEIVEPRMPNLVDHVTSLIS